MPQIAATLYGKRTWKKFHQRAFLGFPNVLIMSQVGPVWFLSASAKPNWCNPWATWSKVVNKWMREVNMRIFWGTWFINESWISQLVSRISWNVMIPIPSIFVLCFWMAWHWQNEIRWYKNPGSSGGWSEVSSPHREVIYAAMGSSFFFEQIQRIQKNPKWLAKDWRKGKK